MAQPFEEGRPNASDDVFQVNVTGYMIYWYVMTLFWSFFGFFAVLFDFRISERLSLMALVSFVLSAMAIPVITDNKGWVSCA